MLKPALRPLGPLLLTLCISHIARAQESESAQTVPRGTLQIESGIAGFTRARNEREFAVGEQLVRLGLGPKTELRVGVPAYAFLRGTGRTAGFGDAYIGVKRTLFGDQKAQLAPVAGNEGQTQSQAQQDQAQRDANRRGRTKRAGASGAQQSDLPRPALGIILGTSLPTGADALSANRFEPQALLAFEASLSQRVSLASNVGYTRVAGERRRFGQVFGSLALGYSVDDKLGYFAEVFGVDRASINGDSEAFLNLGAVYVLSDTFELDAAIAPSLSNNARRNYQVGLGFTKRF